MNSIYIFLNKEKDTDIIVFNKQDAEKWDELSTEICKVSIKSRTTTVLYLNKSPRDFPGSPVVKIPCFQCRGAQVQSLVQELRSHMLCDTAKKKKEIKLDS